MPTGDSVYSPRFIRGLEVAARLHERQARKGSGVPYVSHLLGACSIALDYGADEDTAIAALLHDAIEDVQPTALARAAVASFGERVLATVEAVTDADTHPKPPWRERKERSVASLANADASALLVSGADKLHNVRSMLADLRRDGASLWDRFNATREEILWYHRATIAAMRANPAHNRYLVDEVERVINEVERT